MVFNPVKIEIMKILIVKLSSLGDVLHTLPVIWDLRERYPLAQIDWAVEEAYVDLLKPLKTLPSFAGIDRVIPIAFRRWKKSLKRGEFVKSIKEYICCKH
jgi:heptosyltransferase-1